MRIIGIDPGLSGAIAVLDDLKILAKECNLLVKNGSKNKTKQVLYDEINSYHLNQ